MSYGQSTLHSWQQLRQQIDGLFNRAELEQLIFDLGIDNEHLAGSTKPELIISLIRYTEQHHQLPQLISELKKARPGESWAFAPPAEPDAEPPFKGLQYFTEKDAPIFFGREQLISNLIEHLKAHPFLAVVGASGSGKSSIVRAGILPAIRHGTLQRHGILSTDWLIHVITPGSEPLKALAASLTRDSESVTAMKTLMTDMQADRESLHLWLYRKLVEEENRLFLLIDQFEELFTQCHDPDSQRLFIENLVHAMNHDPQERITLVLTLRADFYTHALNHEPLRPLLEMRQKIVGAMSYAELEQAITRPAEAAKWHFQPGLVATILSDVGYRENRQSEPGALPLLSHALLETWQRRDGRTMTLAGYLATGGVRKAIATTADAVLAQMSSDAQRIARNIFLRLTELGQETEATRRRISFKELLPNTEEADDIQIVLTRLADARLIITGEGQVEVAHEALIREWPVLRRWLDENREGLQLHQEITLSAQKWVESGQDTSYLYQGVRLERVLVGITDSIVTFNAQENAFLTTSQEVETAKKEAREAAYQRELVQSKQLAEMEQQRADIQTKAAQRSRRLTYGLAVAFVLAVGMLVFAARQLQVARGRQLLTQAQILVKEVDKLGLATLLTLESNNLVDSTETANLLAEIPYVWPQFTGQRLAEHTSWVMSTAWSADGRLATSSEDGVIILWDDLFGQPVQTFTVDDQIVISVAWSPDGRLASGSDDGKVIIWDVESGERLQTLSRHAGSVQSVAWSQDGLLASGSGSSDIIIWDVAADTTKQTFSDHSSGVLSVAWSPDGRLASGSADRTVKVWDVENGTLLKTLSGHTDLIWSVAWSPDGRLASGSDDDTIIIWDLETGQPETIFNHTSNIITVGWSPDGRLASGSTDGRVIIWNEETKQPDQIFTANSSTVISVSWSQDGRLASGSGDGTAIIWDEAPEQTISTFSDHIDWVNSVAWSQNGRLASGSADSTVIIWDEVTKHPVQTLSGHSDFIESVAWAPDGRLASGSCFGRNNVAACTKGEIIIWNLETGNPQQILLGHEGIISTLAWAPDGRLASGSGDKSIIIWDLAAEEPAQTLTGHSAEITHIAWSQDGRLASASNDHTAIIWDVESEEPAQILKGHTDVLGSVAWSQDGRLVTGASDNSVIVWNLDTGTPTQTLFGHSAPIRTVAWSSTGLLASGATDGSIIFWDLDLEQPRQILSANSAPIREMAWDSNGRLATASTDRTVRVIPATFTNPPCQWLFRNMTEVEWLTHMAPFAWSSQGAFAAPTSMTDYLNLLFVSTYQPTCPNLPVPEVRAILSVQGRLLYGGAALLVLVVLGLLLFGLRKLVRKMRLQRLHTVAE